MVLSRTYAGVSSVLSALITIGVIAGGPVKPPAADPPPDPVSKVIVRYSDGAPVKRADGKPWGAQCVDRRYRERLVPGRALGEGMYVVRLRPPVEPGVAARIARQLSRCPGVAWAEAPTVVFTPGA